MGFLKLVMSFLAVWLLFLCAVESVEGRTMDSSLLAKFGAGDKGKRQIFDASCRGLYDRGILRQLDGVCEDCYNLYRKPTVATECRRNCYTSEIFESCLRDLMLHEFVEEYKDMVKLVAGKK